MPTVSRRLAIDSWWRCWPTAYADLLQEIRMKKIYEKPLLARGARLSDVTATVPSSIVKAP
jgi:hypothetical protein